MVAKTIDTAHQAPAGLRPMDATRDLRAIADLVAEAFADEIDERGRAALREMRWMARLSPLVWWWAQADPTFPESFNGFVWEEPAARGRRQVVGNVSLSRAPGDRQRWIIANVVVSPAYRRRGIGQHLVEAAIAEARDLGARGVVLQVFEDNRGASHLYTDLGFRRVACEAEFRLAAVPEVAFLDAPGYDLKPWQPADGEAAYQLALRATPAALQWLRPLRAETYRRDWLLRSVEWLSDLAAGRRTFRLLACRDGHLAAMLTLTAAFRQGEHRIALLVHPEDVGRVEAALVSRALHMLAAIPPRPVRVAAYGEHKALRKVLLGYGFEAGRQLLTMQRDF